ncbi:MAG: succinylglutamate desuccinylase/aspartoacylase family protein, partial [Planctomycetota bacterium]
MSAAPPPAAQAPPRELGRHDRGVPGPTLLVLAGVHGNEPAGVAAAQRVLAELARRDAPIRGRLVAFAGNLGALALGRRY